MSAARRRTVKALVVLGSVLAFFSVFAIWTERQAFDTDDWVETSDDLIADETIRAAVADYLVDQLYENVDVEQELEDILPGDFKDLAGPASGGLRQVAGEGAERVLETSTAQTLWQEANRTAHEELVAVLEDEKEGVSTDEGEVTLDLAELVTNLAQEVGIGAQLAEQLPEDAGQVTILRSEELQTAQDVAAAIKGLALVLSLLTFLSFGLAIYLSRGSRWVTVLFCGIGLIAAGFATIVAREIIGGIVVDQLVSDESVRPAAESAWAISTSLMTSIAVTAIVIGVLFGIAGWLGSPTGSARTARRFVAPLLRDHVPWVYATLAILVGFYFLAAPTQNLRSFLTTLVVAGLAAFGIHELRKQTEEEFPDAELNDYFGGAKRAVAGAVKNANIGERASKLRLPEKRDAEATPPAVEEKDRWSELERLAELRDKGVLTEEEFAAEKARLLGGGSGS
jgi:Short C-terminal domain